MTTNVNKIFKTIVSKGLIEDRLEYDVEDLMLSYELDTDTAKVLFDLIHNYDN